MRRLVIGFLSAALGVFVACGGASPSPSDGIVVALVSPDDLEPQQMGRASWSDDGPVRIVVRTGLSSDMTAATVAHELWHAMTLEEGHPIKEGGSFFGCMSFQHVNLSVFMYGDACPEELEMIPREAQWRVVPEEAVREATERAAAFWNRALGREAIVVD